MVAIVCWHIWKARNEVRNSDAKVCPTTTVKKVIAYAEMIGTHCLKPSQPLRCAAPKQIKKEGLHHRLIWSALMLMQRSLPPLRVRRLEWSFEII